MPSRADWNWNNIWVYRIRYTNLPGHKKGCDASVRITFLQDLSVKLTFDSNSRTSEFVKEAADVASTELLGAVWVNNVAVA